ncbi:MAG: tetratricopeptide repeat protein, partial [Odoribacter sp.]|nr:tetratricopeptide repeat protein [Odoribacter sp.]
DILQSHPTDFHLLGLIYSQYGAIHARQGNYQEAQLYYQKSLNTFTKIKDTIPILMGAKQLAWIYFSQEKYEQSKEVLQKGIDIIEQNKKHTNNLLLIKTHASLLNGLNLYYQKIQNHDEALKVSKQAIIQLEKENIHVPSNYYSALITTYIEKHQIDSIYPYCQKMLTNSIKENNLLNQLTVYKNLIDYEKTKGNYKPLSEYQEKYIELKDTYNKQLKFNEIIKLEKRYNYSEKERLYYKTKTKNLWLLIFMLILIIIASLILLYSTWLQRKLKDKNLQLSEQIKKVEWGLVLSKELIRDNSNQYIQLEKVLNRYATLVPQQLFEEFRSLHHTQQIHYSEHLLFSLTNINSEFSRRLKQKHPNLTSNDILLASMLHYQWELDDIAHIFQTSLEAIQKRSVRLKTKLERKEPDIKSLEKYLSKI